MSIITTKLVAIMFVPLIGLSPLAEAKLKLSTAKFTDAIYVAQIGKTQPHVVQIFSSVNATKAEGMKNTLEMQGYRAFVNIKAKHQQPYYQVQIGPFRSRSLANDAKIKIVRLYPEFPFLNDAILKVSF